MLTSISRSYFGNCCIALSKPSNIFRHGTGKTNLDIFFNAQYSHEEKKTNLTHAKILVFKCEKMLTGSETSSRMQNVLKNLVTVTQRLVCFIIKLSNYSLRQQLALVNQQTFANNNSLRINFKCAWTNLHTWVSFNLWVNYIHIRKLQSSHEHGTAQKASPDSWMNVLLIFDSYATQTWVQIDQRSS